MEQKKNKFEYSEAFLDIATFALVSSSCTTDNERVLLECISEVCIAHGISIKKYLEVLNAINTKYNARLKEKEND